MESSTTQESRNLTEVEEFFLTAGLPVTEVGGCPVPECPVCAAALPLAA